MPAESDVPPPDDATAAYWAGTAEGRLVLQWCAGCRRFQHYGHEVPPVLLSGNHGAVDRWRRDQALRKTVRNRPELLDSAPEDTFDARDREVLAERPVPGGGEHVAN